MEKQNEVPSPPDNLVEEAKNLYNEIYNILIEENRGSAMFNYTVAMAANALYRYKKISDRVNLDEALGVKDLADSIRLLNAAESSWHKASAALMLTPASQVKMRDIEVDMSGDEKPSFRDVLSASLRDEKEGKRKSQKYGPKKPKSRKHKEKTGVTTKKGNG